MTTPTTSRIVAGFGALVLCVTLWVAPVPAARPRVTRWGTYYPKRYTVWMREALDPDNQEWTGTNALLTGPLGVRCIHVMKRPAKPANPWPVGDVDNLAKGPLDVLTKTGRAWKDDAQIVTLVSAKRYATATEKPHTLINIYQLNDATPLEQ